MMSRSICRVTMEEDRFHLLNSTASRFTNIREIEHLW